MLDLNSKIRYISQKEILVSPTLLQDIRDLEKMEIFFTDQEQFSLKTGTIPQGYFLLKHQDFPDSKTNMNFPYLSFYPHSATEQLQKMSDFFKIINPDEPSYGLRFNKLHRFFKRPVARESILKKLNTVIREKMRNINFIVANPGPGKKSFQSIVPLRKEYERLNQLRNEIEFFPDKFVFLESDYFKFNTVDYVYLKFKNDSDNYNRKRFNLSIKQPNVIIMADDFKDCFNRRTDKKLDQTLSKLESIKGENLFSYDIFFERKM